MPVPPPMPAVTNTMSEPSSISEIRDSSSSAASRPTFGFAPEPSPFVMPVPSWSFLGHSDWSSTCASVFAAMNSTPPSPDWIIRFTALPPAPPTPITLIEAPNTSFPSSISSSIA